MTSMGLNPGHYFLVLLFFLTVAFDTVGLSHFLVALGV